MPSRRLPRFALLFAAAPALFAQGLVNLNDGQDNTTAYDLTDLIEFAVSDLASATQSGVLSGSGAVLHSGPGTLILSGANTYSGATTIAAGTLSLTHVDALGSAAGATVVASGATLNLANITLGTESLTLSGAGVSNVGSLTGTGTASHAGAITLAGGSSIGGDGNTLTLSGSIGESGGARTLTKVGDGTLVLSGSNTHAGGTVLYDGTLAVSSDANLGAPTAPLTFDFGTLQLLGDLDLSARTVTATASGGVLDTNGNAATLSNVQALGPVFRAGAGSLTLTGNNTFASGLLSQNTGSLTVAPGATVHIGDGATTGYLYGAVAIEGTLVFNPSAGAPTSYDAAFPGDDLHGAGTVSKVGDGALFVQNANTYTGGTILSGGVTAITNDTGSAFGTGSVTVQSGATLTGDGFFSGPLSLAAGATLSPGLDEPFYITIGDASVLNGTTLIELGDVDYFDTIEVGTGGAGTVTLGGTLKVEFFQGWAPGGPGAFQIIEAAVLAGAFSGFDLPAGYTWDTSGLTAGGNGILQLTAIPEPSSYATFAAVAALGLTACRRRRRAK